MAVDAARREEMAVTTPSRRRGVLARMMRKPAAALSLAYLTLLVLVAVFAPFVAPLDPEKMYDDRYHPPSRTYLMGTDNLGRDIFSRLVYGSRLSLSVGFIAVGIAVAGGTVLGLVAGYFGGRVDQITMRIIDVMLAFPGILLALVIIAILGSSLANVMIAIGIATIPTFTRVVRGSTLEIKALEYVDGARAAGAGTLAIMFRHILPNAVQPVIVMATLGVAGALTVLAINLLGDALRDALDPRLYR